MFRPQFLLILTLSTVMLTLAQPAKAEAQTLTSPAGAPITLTGSGPARAGYLLYFGSRAVGGSSVKADGRFSINLMTWRERPGDYQVIVRLRGTPQILLELTCSTPAVDSAVASAPIVVAAPNSLYTYGMDRYNCDDFTSYEDAYAVYQANLPGDPNDLDRDQDGIPCENSPGAP